MYDVNGSPIIGFQDRELQEVFGTLSSKKRKQHHRNYLDKIDKVKLYAVIDFAFITDPTYQQYMDIVTPHYRKLMKGKIIMNFIQSTLLYLQYPQRQHFTLDGLIAVQILFMRKYIYSKMWGLRNSGFTSIDPIKCIVKKKYLIEMSSTIVNVVAIEAERIFPAFINAMGL